MTTPPGSGNNTGSRKGERNENKHGTDERGDLRSTPFS